MYLYLSFSDAQKPAITARVYILYIVIYKFYAELNAFQ